MSFRFWLREKWYEYLAECDMYGERPMSDVSQYFRKYKYWLKREYRHQYGKKETGQ